MKKRFRLKIDNKEYWCEEITEPKEEKKVRWEYRMLTLLENHKIDNVGTTWNEIIHFVDGVIKQEKLALIEELRDLLSEGDWQEPIRKQDIWNALDDIGEGLT